MSKHTPGPMRLAEYLGQVYIEDAAAQENVAMMVGDPRRDDFQANARLFVAAPRLLEACKNLLDWADRIRTIRPMLEGEAEMLDNARDAIAAAEGTDHA